MSASNLHPEGTDRRAFLRMAWVVEGGLAVVAIAWAYFAEIAWWRNVSLDPPSLAWAVAATLPLLAAFFALHHSRFGPFRRINDFLLEALGPPLAACRWHDLIVVAALAGACEELLFRGVLQPACEGWGRIPALVTTNLLFGLAHAVSVAYAVLAAGIGFYFSALLDITGSRNLAVPMLTHGLYDYVAFLVVAREYRRGPV